MTKRVMVAAATAMAAVSVGGFVGVGSAGAAPPMPLPDADLVCPNGTASGQEWVGFGVPTIWVLEGALKGHYVVLDQAHYELPGLVYEAPADLPLGKRMGTRTAFEDTQMTCTFISRWNSDDDTKDRSIVGPITIAKVPGGP